MKIEELFMYLISKASGQRRAIMGTSLVSSPLTSHGHGYAGTTRFDSFRLI